MMPATTSLADKFAFDVQGAEALRAKAKAGDEAALRSTAREFEAMVVNMVLKNMRQTRFDDQENDLFGGQSLKMYQDMLDQQWSRKMTETRGFGLSDILVRQFKQQQKSLSPGEISAKAAAVSVPAAPGQATDTGGVGAAGGMPAEQKPALPADFSETQREFMQRLRPHADAAAQRLGVPANFVLAHAALESGWGQREIKRADGSPSYNLFGIKAGQGWQGDTAQVQTTEYQYGIPVKRQEPFRAYAGHVEAFGDYAQLLERRYRGVVGQSDAGSFAFGLQQAGYASDPRYGEKLNRLIQQLA